MSSQNGFHKATSAWKNPMKTISGEKCKICGEPATCAVLAWTISGACKKHGKEAKALGYDVIFSLEDGEVCPRCNGTGIIRSGYASGLECGCVSNKP